MRQVFNALIAGILFGLGLSISQMVNPQRVIGFLDITGHWDPTLLFVMVSALGVTTLGYRRVFEHAKPRWAETFQLPSRSDIDKPLLLGAVIFGLGWGLAGFCPGPAVTGLASGKTEVLVFVAAMLVGMWGQHWLAGRNAQNARDKALAR